MQLCVIKIHELKLKTITIISNLNKTRKKEENLVENTIININ